MRLNPAKLKSSSIFSSFIFFPIFIFSPSLSTASKLTYFVQSPNSSLVKDLIVTFSLALSTSFNISARFFFAKDGLYVTIRFSLTLKETFLPSTVRLYSKLSIQYLYLYRSLPFSSLTSVHLFASLSESNNHFFSASLKLVPWAD